MNLNAGGLTGVSCLFLLLSSALATAQTVHLSALQQWTSEEDFPSPTGVRAGLSAGIWTFAVEHSRDSQQRGAVYCFGLVPPGADCDPKKSRLSTTLTSLLVGLGSRVGPMSGRFEAGVVFMRTRWRSLVSAARFNDEAGYLSLGLGVDVRRRLVGDLHVLAGSGVRFLIAPAVGQCADCETEYEESLVTGGISLGLSYSFD